MQGRDHLDFVCGLRTLMPRKELTDGIEDALASSGFTVQPAKLEDAEAALHREHIKNTRVVTL